LRPSNLPQNAGTRVEQRKISNRHGTERKVITTWGPRAVQIKKKKKKKKKEKKRKSVTSADRSTGELEEQQNRAPYKGGSWCR